MKVDFDANKILWEYMDEYVHDINEYAFYMKEELDSRTPELTMDLIEHNKVSFADTTGLILTASVYNDLWWYAIDVEEGIGEKLKYHKYPDWMAAIYDEPPHPKEDVRDIIKRWDGASMFDDTYEFMEKDRDIFTDVFLK